MERYAKLVTQESERDRFGSAGMMFPRNTAVECDSSSGDEAAFQDRRGLADVTSWNFKMSNFDDSFEDFHRLATSPEPTYVFGRRTPGATITTLGHPLAAATHPLASAAYPLAASGHPLAASAHPLAASAHPLSAAASAHPQASTTLFRASMTRPEAAAAAAGSEQPSVGERARAAWTAIANRHRGLEPCDGQHGDRWSHRDLPAKTAQQIMWELLQDPTFDGSYLLHLLLENVRSKYGPPTPSTGDKPICKFCRNNNEEDIYHQFKDASGLVVCPVLSKHVCDLCGVSGHFAHTRKYCPKNPLTLGCPEEGGFPPGMLPKDVYETTQMMLRMMNSRNNSM